VRLLLDTNILVAATVARGVCAELFLHCSVRHELVTSRALLEELGAVLSRKFRFTSHEADEAVALLSARMGQVAPARLSKPVCRDPKDDAVLAAALGGECRAVVTGDKDLLVLEKWKGIRLISPADFWRFEEREG